ncbi:MAG: tetratricopeptide repeat protein, partial [Nanoarchaeota archaeon]|nr:tetratricopeptide repeat protein [Nanoarchaeota archaeon]
MQQKQNNAMPKAYIPIKQSQLSVGAAKQNNPIYQSLRLFISFILLFFESFSADPVYLRNAYHSWGTVITYQVFKEGDVPQQRNWITMGSPMGDNVEKPRTVDYWLNIGSIKDPIHGLYQAIAPWNGWASGPLIDPQRKYSIADEDYVINNTEGGHSSYWYETDVHEKIAQRLGAVTNLWFVIGVLFGENEEDFKDYSPIEILKKYFDAGYQQDVEKREKIVSINIKDQGKRARWIKYGLGDPKVPMKFRLGYQKGAVANIEIYVGFWWMPWTLTVFDEAVMKKEEGMWKFYGMKLSMDEEILRDLYDQYEDPAYFFVKGFKYSLSKNWKEAKRFYEQYLRIAPKGFWAEKAENGIVGARMGVIGEKIERGEEIRKKERGYEYYFSKGVHAWRYEGDYEKALMYLNKAYDLAPDREKIPTKA